MGARISSIPASEFLASTAAGEYDVEQSRNQLTRLRALAISGTDNLLLAVRELHCRMRAFEVFSLVSVFDQMVPPFAGRLAILNPPTTPLTGRSFSRCAHSGAASRSRPFRDTRKRSTGFIPRSRSTARSCGWLT